ncbi:MAG: phosphoglycerate kinase [Holosporaceae bacterium]|nr:MAG: phosphoglycerate kinase [Holosporaceae bacterium]
MGHYRGAKISTKLPLIKSLIDKVDGLIIGGAMANTLLLSQGKNIGASLVERDLENECKKLLQRLKKKVHPFIANGCGCGGKP